MDKGLFVTFEGNEGCGKTTISNRLYQKLKEEGYDVVLTREPGGIKIAEQIREVILDSNNTEMDARCEALLYAAARRQHLVEKILPALQLGSIVLCDRFIDSSLAYQGVARGLGIDEILHLNEFAIQSCMPDKTLYFELDPMIGLSRIAARKEFNRLDGENDAFHKQVAKGYEQVLKLFPTRIKVIDASQSEEDVLNDAYTYIKTLVD